MIRGDGLGTRTASATAALALVAVAGLSAWTVVVAPTDAAVAALGECPEGTIPAPGPSNPVWTDNNVAIYAGEDFRSEGAAAEAEGLVVVQGDADFSRVGGGTFNVGWVGVGSGVVPSPGEVMLAVGGDLSVGAGTVLDVGANARDTAGELLGGNVQVGGITTPDYETDGSRYRLNHGVLSQELGAAATSAWSTWTADLASESAEFSAYPATGTVTVGATLVFQGTAGADPQVFSVDAAVLAANPAITFLGVADDVPVIVNVTGGPSVTWAPNYFADESGRVDDFGSGRFGVVAARTLWNFADATAVHVAGSSQVLGTILVPGANPVAAEPSLRVTASTNGRLLTGGTIVMDGVGNEHHNYPWISEPFQCIPVIEPPAVGSVAIAKAIDPADLPFVPADVLFHGIVVCEGPGAAGEVSAEWFVRAGETTVVDDLPVGAACTIEESLGVGARAFAPHASGLAFVPTGLAWLAPAWNPSPPEFVVPAATDPEQLTFTVTNALARGAFTIRKIVVGDGAPAIGFTGTWGCALGGIPAGSGEWALDAGEATAPIEAVVGATCAITETAPAGSSTGMWDTPAIAPASVLITPASAQTPLEFIVTNEFTALRAVGGFDIVKVVEDADGVGFVDTFSGTWTCEADGEDVAEGTWTASTTEPFAVGGVPLGAVCTVTETAPADPSGGTWTEARITPASFTVADEETRVTVTVTNVLEGDVPGGDGGGELPVTGGAVPAWLLWIGVGLVSAGALAVGTTAVRPRRR